MYVVLIRNSNVRTSALLIIYKPYSPTSLTANGMSQAMFNDGNVFAWIRSINLFNLNFIFTPFHRIPRDQHIEWGVVLILETSRQLNTCQILYLWECKFISYLFLDIFKNKSLNLEALNMSCHPLNRVVVNSIYYKSWLLTILNVFVLYLFSAHCDSWHKHAEHYRACMKYLHKLSNDDASAITDEAVSSTRGWYAYWARADISCRAGRSEYLTTIKSSTHHHLHPLQDSNIWACWLKH